MKLNTRNSLKINVKGCQAGESALKVMKKIKHKMKTNNEVFSPELTLKSWGSGPVLHVPEASPESDFGFRADQRVKERNSSGI